MLKTLPKIMGNPAFQIAGTQLVAGICWLAMPQDWLWRVFDLFMPIEPETAKWLTFMILSYVLLLQVLRHQMDKIGRSASYARRVQYFVRGLIEHCPLPLVVKDANGTILLANRPFMAQHDRLDGPVTGKTTYELNTPDIADRLAANDRLVMQTHSAVEEDMELMSHGKRRIARVVKFPILDERSEVRGTGTFSIDLTRSHLAESELRQRRYADPHTGLPNREFIARELPRQIAQAAVAGLDLNLLLVSFEGLSRVEATLGQTVADAALIAAIDTVKTCVGDNATIAYLRGWDILVVYPQAPGSRRPSNLANSIIAALSAPLSIAGQIIFATPRIGIANSPKDGVDAGALLTKVRGALTQPAGEGQSAVAVCAVNGNSLATRRLAIETNLRKALERNEFTVNYQAQMSADGERIVGAEALLRWRNEDLGFVSPAEFIPIAEETGLIAEIERWVAEVACREAMNWNEIGGGHIRVAINATATQFLTPDFIRHVTKVLRETGLPARRFEVEITERMLLKNSDTASENLKWLSKLNIPLAIDDFGTGYSSLMTLKTFPFNTVKIDKSFVDDIVDESSDVTIPKTIIGMAKSLGLSVVAEGVETEVQRDILRQLGTDLVQGYLYSRPISAFEFRQFVRRYGKTKAAR